MRPKRRHTITLTFTRGLSEHEARQVIGKAISGLGLFRQLTKHVWDTTHTPAILSYSVKRRK